MHIHTKRQIQMIFALSNVDAAWYAFSEAEYNLRRFERACGSDRQTISERGQD